jgi:hypothetical protein
MTVLAGNGDDQMDDGEEMDKKKTMTTVIIKTKTLNQIKHDVNILKTVNFDLVSFTK